MRGGPGDSAHPQLVGPLASETSTHSWCPRKSLASRALRAAPPTPVRFLLTSGGLNPFLAGSNQPSWERSISRPQDPLLAGTSAWPEQVRGWGREGLE